MVKNDEIRIKMKIQQIYIPKIDISKIENSNKRILIIRKNIILKIDK